MSTGLTAKTCTPCRGGIPALTSEEAQRYLHRRRTGRSWTTDGRSSVPTGSRTSARRLTSWRRRARSPRPRAITRTLHSAGATPRFRCTPRRSTVYTRTTSSWQRSSTGSRRGNADPEFAPRAAVTAARVSGTGPWFHQELLTARLLRRCGVTKLRRHRQFCSSLGNATNPSSMSSRSASASTRTKLPISASGTLARPVSSVGSPPFIQVRLRKLPPQ